MIEIGQRARVVGTSRRDEILAAVPPGVAPVMLPGGGIFLPGCRAVARDGELIIERIGDKIRPQGQGKP